MRALIIDDEVESHEVIRQHTKESEVQILGSGYSKQEGVDLIKQHQPDLLFLDIEMKDGTGFDLLKEVQKFQAINFQVIFITAHNQYAQTAIRMGALDYLLKPVSASELSSAILKAEVRKLQYIQQAQMQIIQDTLSKLAKQELPEKMSISTLKGILYFPTASIIRLDAMQNFTEFKVDGDPRRLIASFNLKKFETDLKPYNTFMRIHRSHIINLHKVVRLKKGERYFVEMIDGEVLPVSKVQQEELVGRLREFTV